MSCFVGVIKYDAIINNAHHKLNINVVLVILLQRILAGDEAYKL